MNSPDFSTVEETEATMLLMVFNIALKTGNTRTLYL